MTVGRYDGRSRRREDKASHGFRGVGDSVFVDEEGRMAVGMGSPGVPGNSRRPLPPRITAKFHLLDGGELFDLNPVSRAVFQSSENETDVFILAIIGGEIGTSQLAFGRPGGSGSELHGRVRYRNATDRMEFFTGFGTSAVLILDVTKGIEIEGDVELTGRVNQPKTSTTADPTTTEYPADGDRGFHHNTTSGNRFWSVNDGGTIFKVQMT